MIGRFGSGYNLIVEMRTCNLDGNRSWGGTLGNTATSVGRAKGGRGMGSGQSELWGMLDEVELFSEEVYQLFRQEERNLSTFKRSIEREKAKVVGQIDHLKRQMIHNVDDLKISILAELDRIYKNYMEKYATLKGQIVQIKKMKEDIELDIERRSSTYLPRYHQPDPTDFTPLHSAAPANASIMRSLEKNNFDIKKSQMLSYIAQLQREKVMPLNELTQQLLVLTHYENGFFQSAEFQRASDDLLADLQNHLRTLHQRKFEFIREPDTLAHQQNSVLHGVYEEQLPRQAPVSNLEDFRVLGVSLEQQSMGVEWAETVTLTPQQPIRSLSEDIALCALEVSRGVVAVGSKDGLIGVYELGGKQLAALRGHKASICKLALVTNNGKKYLASGSDHGCSSIVLWDTSTWSMRMRIESHRAAVTSIVDLQDNRNLISGSYDKTINVYDLNGEGRVVFNLPVNKTSVTALLLNCSGTKLISCGLDDSLNVWQVVRGAGRVVETIFLERVIQNNTMICSLAASALCPDLVLLGAKDGKLKLINIDRGEAYKTLACTPSALIELVLIERKSNPDFPLVVCWPCSEESLRIVNTENGRVNAVATKGFIEFGCGIGPKGFFLNNGRSLAMLSQAKDRREVAIFKIDIS